MEIKVFLFTIIAIDYVNLTSEVMFVSAYFHFQQFQPLHSLSPEQLYGQHQFRLRALRISAPQNQWSHVYQAKPQLSYYSPIQPNNFHSYFQPKYGKPETNCYLVK